MCWRSNHNSKTLCKGVVTSPHHPGNYPKNLEKTETIQVESGKILRLEFTQFSIHVCGDINTCWCDYVKITDGDGTILMDKSCGDSTFSIWSPASYFLPPIITTRSNVVNIFFFTNGNDERYGWSLSWSAVTPGLKILILTSWVFGQFETTSFRLIPFHQLYHISECSLASPGSPCNNLEDKDCKYEHIGEHCCCGQCSGPAWLSLACVLNSTTGAGFWQPIKSILCPAEGCGSQGERSYKYFLWIQS